MITFTQFLRPYGEPRPMEIERPPAIEAIAKQLIDDGCHFDIEELTTGMISMTCENDNLEDGDTVLAHELCPNGPPVLAAVDKLVSVTYARLAELKRIST